MKDDTIERQQFLSHKIMLEVHGEEAPIGFRLLKRNAISKLVESVTHERRTAAEAVKRIPEWWNQGVEVFMLVGMNDGSGYAAENTYGAHAFAVDLDRNVDIDALLASPVRPSIMINTSPGKYHLIWVLTAAIDPEMFEMITRAVAFRLGGDSCFANLTQAIRLSGFINGKHGNLVSVRLPAPGDTAPVYDLERLVAGLDVELSVAALRSRYHGYDSKLAVKRTTESAKDVMRDLESALQVIPADAYDDWIMVLAGLSNFGEDGRPLAERWSKTCSAKFNQKDFDSTWQSFSKSTNRRRVQPASIFHKAAQLGWSNPGYKNEHKQDDSGPLTDRELGERLSQDMLGDYVAVRVGTGQKQSLEAGKWTGQRYNRLDKFVFRKDVEDRVRNLFGRPGEDGTRKLSAAIKTKIGTTGNLDAICMAALEYLVPLSENRAADCSPYLSVANGAINLLSGELVPANLRPVSRPGSPVTFDPYATAPRFVETLSQIFQDDQDMVEFFLRLGGYIMLGTPKEHQFVIFFGPTGRNGKSLLVDLLRTIFGSLACPIPTSTIMVKGTMTDGATPALAKLQGVRLAIINEPNAKHQLDSGLIKQLTGGDQISARALYADDVYFTPEFTPIMVTNVLPKVHEGDDALWARFLIVPFLRTFGPDEIDRDLKEKLLREAPGILNLLIKGVHDYLAHGLQVPPKCRATASEQRKEADPLELWMEDRATDRPGHETPLKAIYDDYVGWTKENPVFRALSKRELSKKLERRYEKVDRRHLPYFLGIGLISTAS